MSGSVLYYRFMRIKTGVEPVPLLANGQARFLSPGLGCRYSFMVPSVIAKIPALADSYKAALDGGNILRFGSIQQFPAYIDRSAAQTLLSANTNNRKLRTSIVTKYASDMSRDKWKLVPVPICFDENGNLGNGQHTLNAIITSGKPQFLQLALNVPRESIAMMDVGLNRTIEDISHFIGADLDSPCAAIAKILLFGKAYIRVPVSFETIYDTYLYYKDAVDFAVNTTKGVKVSGVNAITRSVVAMAWYTQDRVRLIEFMECIHTGVINGKGDMAAAKLRDLFMKRGVSGGSSRVELFEKTKTALEHFLARNPISKLYGTEKEVFPYPKFEA